MPATREAWDGTGRTQSQVSNGLEVCFVDRISFITPIWLYILLCINMIYTGFAVIRRRAQRDKKINHGPPTAPHNPRSSPTVQCGLRAHPQAPPVPPSRDRRPAPSASGLADPPNGPSGVGIRCPIGGETTERLWHGRKPPPGLSPVPLSDMSVFFCVEVFGFLDFANPQPPDGAFKPRESVRALPALAPNSYSHPTCFSSIFFLRNVPPQMALKILNLRSFKRKHNCSQFVVLLCGLFEYRISTP